jgi:predicted small lipoprotein YifL
MRLHMLAAVSALTLAITAALAACGSDGPAANSLAAKIDCGNVTQAPQNSNAQQEIDCDLVGGSAVEIATFGSTSDRNSWINGQPVATCCAAGSGWAATVTPGGSQPVGPMLQQIARKLDGQQVKVSS